MTNTSRMTSFQRREQLIDVGRSLFATKGFEAVSVEEIAATAKVSKPIVYEHFGGKEGLYAVVVDREMRSLTSALTDALSLPSEHPRQIVERSALTLLTYIEEHAEGFRVLVRDSPSTDPAGSFSSLLGDVSLQVEQLLADAFKRQHLPARGVPYYAQMLVGMTVFTGQYWADRRKISKEQLAAHIVNLAWYGLSRMEAKPTLRFEGERARHARAQQLAQAAKAKKGQRDPQNRQNQTSGETSTGKDHTPNEGPAGTTSGSAGRVRSKAGDTDIDHNSDNAHDYNSDDADDTDSDVVDNAHTRAQRKLQTTPRSPIPPSTANMEQSNQPGPDVSPRR